MLIVIDANELFSLLIRGTQKSEIIFFSNKINLIAPKFIITEFYNNRKEILEKTHRSKEDFNKLISIFKRRIKLIPKQKFNNLLEKAKNLFPEHQKDASYLALALKYNCPLWTEEKLLKEQPLINVFNTYELFNFLKSKNAL